MKNNYKVLSLLLLLVLVVGVFAACNKPGVKHTVTFVTNNNTVIENKLVADGKRVDKPTEVLVKDGYVFIGWYKQGETTKYSFNNKVKDNTTLVAIWETDYIAQNLTLKVESNKQLRFTFELNNDFDLGVDTNQINVKYFKVVNGVDVAIKNTNENANLVKNKGWAGFLVHEPTQTRYVKGTVGQSDYNDTYSNMLPKNTRLDTIVRDRVSSDGSVMAYHDIDWSEENTFKVVLQLVTQYKTFEYSISTNNA